MPEPIRNSSRSDDLASTLPPPEDLACPAPAAPVVAANQCEAAQPVAASAAPDASSALVERYTQKDYSAFIASSSAPPTDVTTRSYFNAGSTSAESGGGTASASLVKAQGGGKNAELGFASVQGGAANVLQIGVAHGTSTGKLLGMNVSTSVDVLDARANLGVSNDDGSKGANVGAMATAAGVEVTVEHSGWSLTAGVSLSAGVAVSSGGDRDVDGDGVTENCFKASIGPATLGVCTEL